VRIIINDKFLKSFVLFSRVSQDKKPIEVNRRPILAIDKENEIDKRRKELARQKEAREKQTKDEVDENKHMKYKSNTSITFRPRS
jgi:hypothetical protein